MHPADIPYGILLFNGMLWIEWAGVLFCCAKGRPFRRFAGTSVGARLRRGFKRNFPRIARLETSIMNRAVKLSESKYLRPVSNFLGLSPKEFTASLAETTVLYNVAFPLWIHLNLLGVKRYFKRGVDQHREEIKRKAKSKRERLRQKLRRDGIVLGSFAVAKSTKDEDVGTRHLDTNSTSWIKRVGSAPPRRIDVDLHSHISSSSSSTSTGSSTAGSGDGAVGEGAARERGYESRLLPS